LTGKIVLRVAAIVIWYRAGCCDGAQFLSVWTDNYMDNFLEITERA